MRYASGSTYNGAWENDLKHGMGLYRHHDQSVYSGRWVRGLMDGTGEYKWPEGGGFTTFVGQFRFAGCVVALPQRRLTPPSEAPERRDQE